ncbi:glucosaminidase domain-containing protein, partial [Christensenella tenuis]
TIGSIGFESDGKSVTKVYQNKFTVRAFSVADAETSVESVKINIWRIDGKKHWEFNAVRENATTWAQYVGVDGPGMYNIDVSATDKEGNVSEKIYKGITVLKSTNHPIMGTQDATRGQMINYLNSKLKITVAEFQTRYKMTVAQFVDLYIEEANEEGVKADVAFIQMCHETGYLKYGGDVQWTQYNFAGIGATGNGNPGNSFTDVRTGIRAQIQHLKAYACTDPLKNACVDPRFHYVTRGCAPTIEKLTGTWAADSSYADKIIAMLDDMIKTSSASATALMELSGDEQFIEEPTEEQETAPNPSQESEPEQTQEPEPTPEPEVTAEQDDTPELMGETEITQGQANAYLVQEGIDIAGIYGVSNEEFVKVYWTEAEREGVNAGIAFAQMFTETGGMRFGGKLAAAQNNPGGIQTEDGTPYVFETINEGICAHIQHIKCYASANAPQGSICDPEWNEADRGIYRTMKAWADGNGEYLQLWKDIYNALQKTQAAAEETQQPEPEMQASGPDDDEEFQTVQEMEETGETEPEIMMEPAA